MAVKRAGQSSSLDGNKLSRELFGLFAIFFGLLLMLSLLSFDSRDPWFNHVVSNKVKVYNKAGLFGSYTSGLLLDMVGYAAWVVPAFFCLAGARRILGSSIWPMWRWLSFIFMILVASFWGASRELVPATNSVLVNPSLFHDGGLLGHMLYATIVSWLGTTGAWLVWTLCLLLSIQMLVGFSWLVLVAGSLSMLWQTTTRLAGDAMTAQREKKLFDAVPNSKHVPEPLAITTAQKLEPAPWDTVEPERPLIRESAVTFFERKNAVELAADGEEIFPLSLDDNSHSKSGKEEVDLPPWVRDFEVGILGIDDSEGQSLAESLVHPRITSSSVESSFDNVRFDYGTDEDMHLTVPVSTNDQEGLNPRQASAVPGAFPPMRFKESSEFEDVMPEEAQPENEVPVILKKEKRGSIFSRASARLSLPSLSLIEALPVQAKKASREILEQKGKSLMTCLTDFGIQSELVGITPGPVVTMFEIRPAPGVRVSRIANLSDDIALALRAVAVRVQAPIPGTDTVGIEIPNDVRETVCLRELLSSAVFKQSASLLTLALGKDTAGHPAVADLASMPHLLVAGATGAGKSVGINSIILSLLYKAKPDEVRLLLIDPKRVEMAIYADLPHLVHPVVTDMQLAKNALDWAVKEMEKRYEEIARAGVRNIADYNAKLKELGDKRPPGLEGLERIPYLIIIIDELADLMMTASKEVEMSIVRLAQLARAAGIHLILATQRPSVDVVTGIIKANFPCRIAFQVTSKHDSRTILDTVGAEHLLGKGDMLFKPGGGRFKRMHGAFVSDKNVLAVADYWRALQKPVYDIDFAEWLAPEAGAGIYAGGSSDVAADPMYREAVEFVRHQGKASISLIQRKFRIGFNKAARYIEQMEQDGVVGPADGSKPRQTL